MKDTSKQARVATWPPIRRRQPICRSQLANEGMRVPLRGAHTAKFKYTISCIINEMHPQADRRRADVWAVRRMLHVRPTDQLARIRAGGRGRGRPPFSPAFRDRPISRPVSRYLSPSVPKPCRCISPRGSHGSPRLF